MAMAMGSSEIPAMPDLPDVVEERAKSADPKLAKKDNKKGKKISPYFAFCNQNRGKAKAQLVAAGQPSSASHVAKCLGEMWRSLSDSEKSAFSSVIHADSEANNDFRGSEEGETEANNDLGGLEGVTEAGVQVEAGPSSEEGLAFPLGRVKRIIKLDEDIKLVSGEGMRAITGATKAFLECLVEAAFDVMVRNKHKSIRKADVEQAVKNKSRFHEFIGDSLACAKPVMESDSDDNEDEAGNDEDEESGKSRKVAKKQVLPPPPPGSRCITDFFGNSKNAGDQPIAEADVTMA